MIFCIVLFVLLRSKLYYTSSVCWGHHLRISAFECPVVEHAFLCLYFKFYTPSVDEYVQLPPSSSPLQAGCH